MFLFLLPQCPKQICVWYILSSPTTFPCTQTMIPGSLWDYNPRSSSNQRSKQSQLHLSGHNTFVPFIYSSPFRGSPHKPCALRPPGFAPDSQSPSFGIQTKWNYSLWINSSHSNSKELWLSDYWLCSRYFKSLPGSSKPQEFDCSFP